MKEQIGKVTIAPDVLLTIVRLTVLDVPGVAHLSTRWPGGAGRILTPTRLTEGIRIEVTDSTVAVEVHVAVHPHDNLLALARTIQQEVARAIHDMVGMTVGAVNVHIEDIIFPAVGD
ncbi:MAG: Asp23/Gls24 family envelope stress response protein [Chloroflexi bacterium]|nr:Asp23/Gls24 family envelope stress response protein [Chloroflexota bacterium]